jgi:multiple antibiotic resistance protein
MTPLFASLQFSILAFSSLFAMVNPVSAAPMFLQLTQAMEGSRRKVARRASITALITLGLFATVGGAIFSFFGITVPAFQIAGGILFTISGIRVLQGLPEHGDVSEEDAPDPSVVPIGIPLIAGAGSISTVMVLAGQIRDNSQAVGLGVAIALNALITYIVLASAPRLMAFLGKSGSAILNRIMGLLTAVIGVQFMLNGGSAVIVQLVHEIRR